METRKSNLPFSLSLGPADMASLAAGVGQLTRTGLPLPAGLRALADESSGRRLKAELRTMAERLEKGDSLEDVLNSAGTRLPPHFHGLLLAGLKAGRLPEVMDEYLRVEQERRQLRQRMQINLAYVTLLSIAMTLFAFFIHKVYLKEMGALIAGIQGSDYYPSTGSMTFFGMFTMLALKLFGQVAWISAGFSIFLLLMPLMLSDFRWLAWLTPASDNLPFIGPLLRNLRMASCCRVAALMLENETPLADAIRLSGTAVGDVFLARDCRKVAAEVERGRPLTESLADYRRFSRNLIPLVEWGQQTDALPQSFRVAARLYEDRAKNESLFINTVFAPCMFAVIAGFIVLVGAVVAMPTASYVEQFLSPFGWIRRRTFPAFKIPPGFDFSSMFSPALLGFALLTAKRLITPQRDPTNENLIEMGLRVTGWVLIAVGLLGNLVMMMGLLSIFWIPILIVVCSFIALKRRCAMQRALLETMAVTAERFLPLTSAIEAFAEDVGGRFGVRAMRLADLLHSGVALPDALWQVKRLVPKKLYPIIRLGYQSGALAQGLSEAAAADDRDHALWSSFAAKMLYIAALPCIGFATVFYALAYFLQLYKQTLRSLGTPPLPSPTQTFIAISDYVRYAWPLFALIILFFGLLFLYGTLRYLGVSLFDLPGTKRLLRRQHTAAILDGLALAVEHSHSVYGVFRSLSECYPKNWIRAKLEEVRYDIENSAEWCESLYQQGLIGQSDWAVLQSAQRTGNLAWALRETAESNRRRLAYLLNNLMQMLFPPVVLCFGAIVLFVVIAMFLPLISIIEHWANP